MGGHRGGQTASREAVEKIAEVFLSSDRSPEGMLRAAFAAANAHIYALSRSSPDLRGMGTTGVVLLVGGTDTAWVAHVGDSRAYLVRGGSLRQLTEDHSVVASLVRRGLLSAEEARTHPRRNEVLRSIGPSPELAVDVSRIAVEPGDCFMTCSDGLTQVVSDEEIHRTVADHPPARAAKKLVELAKSRRAPDNVTVQIARLS
jgi:protein phosphatase